MDNFSKLIADMLGKGQSLNEVARAVAIDGDSRKRHPH